VILARDDEFYWLTKDSYQDGKHDAPTSMVSQARLLAEKGVLLAEIPVGSAPDVGDMCFLVNLSGIRPRLAASPARTNPTEGRQPFIPKPIDSTDPCLGQATPAMDDLIILDRDGLKFFWVKKCEYQRPECKLDAADPILDEQVRLLTNQGVVLADVPGGSLLGVDEMGCLVNLHGLLQTKIKEEKEAEEPPASRPLPPGPDDLVILARDDEFYWLTKDSYQHREVTTSMGGQVKLLTEQGVLLADIPVGSIPGVGAMCFLVNLSSIRPRPAAGPTNAQPADGRQPFQPAPVNEDDPCVQDGAPAMDDLIILDREGLKFFWVKKCEYQRPECKLDAADPILDEQVRLLTNQGVVLADVPGGSLLGVDEMGCLVNLHGLLRPRIKARLEAEEGTEQGEEEEETPTPAPEEPQPNV
jgi:hypothetical protein